MAMNLNLLYHAVQFIDEPHIYDIVHTNWIVDEKSSLWPDNEDQKSIPRFRLNGTTKKSWQAYRIRILSSNDDLLTLRAQLNSYVDDARETSAFESDSATSLNKRKRMKKRVFDIDGFQNSSQSERKSSARNYESDESSDSPMKGLKELELPTNFVFPEKIISSTPIVGNPEAPFILGNIASDNTCCNSFNIVTEESNHLGSKSVFNLSSSSTILNVDHSEVIPASNGSKDAFSENVIKSINTLAEKILLEFQYLKSDICKIKTEIGDIKSHFLSKNDIVVDSTILELLPIKSREHYDILAEKLEVLPNERIILIKWLSLKCGRNSDDIIWNIMENLMAKQFSLLCNWTGANSKLQIRTSWFMQLINGVLLKNQIKTTEKEIRSNIMSFLKRAWDNSFHKQKRLEGKVCSPKKQKSPQEDSCSTSTLSLQGNSPGNNIIQVNFQRKDPSPRKRSSPRKRLSLSTLTDLD